MAIGAALLVSFAEGIASQLGSLSLTHLGPFFCGKGDLQALADTVSTVKAVLLDEEKQQGQSNAIGLWLENLIDAIYDADELLDDLSTKAELREANEVCVYLFFSKLADCVEMGPQIQPILRHANKVCASVCLFFPKLADGVADSIVMCPKIKALRKRLDAIADDRQKFHLKEHPHVDTRVRNREIDTLSYEPKEEVIGRDHDRKSVIELLMDSNITEDVSILAIVGVGGLGKTTLAKHIFNDEKIKTVLNLFPKDYRICKSILVKLWMAQGFIHLSEQDHCFEDVGNVYFLELLRRSFFQEAELDAYGEVISCKMHDLMHDLAVFVAGSFMTTLDYKKKAIDVKTRHLSVDDRKSLCVVPNFKLGRMRTIIFPFASTLYVPRHDSNLWTNYLSTWDSLKFLRALDVSYGRFLGLECSIGDLKQLRYLDLSHNNSIKKLPDSITRLQNLQTLRLNGCAELQELHKDMKKLVNLRHVENEKCGSLTHMPRGMGEMTNLQTLSTFVVSFRGSISVDSGGLNELKGLNNLRGNLVIEGLRHGKDAELEYKAADLKEKQYLQSLNLSWWHINRTEVVREEMLWEGLQPHPNLKKLTLKLYPDVRFPNWLLLLTNLVGLELEDCRNLQYLPQLSQLPSLESFSLFKLYNLEYIQSDNGDSNMFSASSSTTPLAFFPSLKKIHLTDCPRLKGWSRRTVTSMMEQPLIPSFPRLSFFKVKDCPMLSSTPMFPHLEEKLELDGASWKPVQQTMMAYVAAPQCPSTVIASSFNPLSKLKRLELISIADLQSFPEEGLQNLIGLQYLSIRFCDRLQSLSRGIQHLTALQEFLLQGPRGRTGTHCLRFWKTAHSLMVEEQKKFGIGTLSSEFITKSEALQCLQKRNDEDVEEERKLGKTSKRDESTGTTRGPIKLYKIAHVPRCNRPIFEVGAIGGYSSFLQGFRILASYRYMCGAGGAANKKHLEWPSRYKIAVGAARGLAYLHHDCIPHIIHRDIKSSNILLDHNMEARVSDFGLATLMEPDKTHVSTFVAGTFGYLAPEYFDTRRATSKGDVYSFGVVLLELLTGKKPNDEAFIEEGTQLTNE
ncbi:hypothetical protein CJ030_MR1G023825 [Morella rubra]|uniref:non-specific serine/threonine protein kinase n=1 Tax=Morella rubra TaxID=262757 RepID=A0A6A1WQ87_9ROSI|nr:hypothetical protein CJ030_MR1G023825 [Morella rubra]